MQYPSDLSDAEWDIIKPFVDKVGVKFGRPREVDIRRVLDAIFYVNRTGCQWRYLPTDFPPWSAVYAYFSRWQASGKWQKINDALRRQIRSDVKKK